MKLSLMAAISKHSIIGYGPDIPWQVKGEQRLVKATTDNQWWRVGPNTFDAIGKLGNRNYTLINRTRLKSNDAELLYFPPIDDTLSTLGTRTDHALVPDDGEIYSTRLPHADTLHLSIIDTQMSGNIYISTIPQDDIKVCEQECYSTLDYGHQIWQNRP